MASGEAPDPKWRKNGYVGKVLPVRRQNRFTFYAWKKRIFYWPLVAAISVHFLYRWWWFERRELILQWRAPCQEKCSRQVYSRFQKRPICSTPIKYSTATLGQSKGGMCAKLPGLWQATKMTEIKSSKSTFCCKSCKTQVSNMKDATIWHELIFSPVPELASLSTQLRRNGVF